MEIAVEIAKVARTAAVYTTAQQPVQTMSTICSVSQLHQIYGQPGETSLVKEIDRLTPQYRRLVESSPFAILATVGPEGLDCSPRGDRPGFVRVRDDRTLLLPDRRGNNRIDSLCNIVRDPRVALLFMIPGSGTTLRVNGRAQVIDDPPVRETFAVDGQSPRTVIDISIDSVYFQCARAIVRADLWNPDNRIDARSLPTPGEILAAQSTDRVGGDSYDRDWPERARNSLW
jgi:PPOX class probable FMN-dependent enzyme